MLPNLAALARGTLKAGEPTGTLLDYVPEEVLQLVTKHLAVKNAGEWDSVCRDLEAWCRVRPIACTSPELWKGAFEAAFGPLVDVNAFAFERNFPIVYPGLPLSNPLPYDAMFKATCKLFTRFDRPAFQNVAKWTNAMLDKKCDEYRDLGPIAFKVWRFLMMRGARPNRIFYQESLKVTVLTYNGEVSAQSVTNAQKLLDDQQLDPDYVFPVDDGRYQPHSLLYQLLFNSDDYGVHKYQLAELLLKHGADPNGVDVHGHQLTFTTLHAVIQNERVSDSNALNMFKLLLEHGADTTRKNRVYGTPHQALTKRYALTGKDRFRDLLDALDAAIAKRATDAAGATGAAPRS